MSKNVPKTGFEERYKRLNDEQRNAVDSIDGPVLVIAGPGSGKTEVLALRVANILKNTDADPASVLCITFTDAAAANMRERLSGLIGPAAYRVSIHTFHSLGAEIIARSPERFFGGASVAPAPDTVCFELAENLLAAEPFNSPLSSKKPDGSMTYADALVSAVSDLKRAGISPEEYSAALEHDARWIERAEAIMVPVLSERLSKKAISQWRALAQSLDGMRDELADDPYPIPHMRAWIDAAQEIVYVAAERAEALDSTEPLTLAKERLYKRDDDKNPRLIDSISLPKRVAFARMYGAYRQALIERGFIDFDDMLMEAIGALERDGGLQADLQERYQYVLVDEFQDTNDAQLRLVRSIASPDSNDGRPNVMAVGDDDQAIYKFQGASSSNLEDFLRLYGAGQVQLVTMTKNYRSSQVVLDLAREVAIRGDGRIEDRVPAISKILSAHGGFKDAPAADVTSRSYATDVDEYDAVASDISDAIAAGENPNDIAVITRSHASLEAIVPHLVARSIPVRYRRRSDVLSLEHVDQVVGVARYLVTQDDSMLPTILAYPFWGIDRVALWKLSRSAYEGRMRWIDAMMDSEELSIKIAADFLIRASALAKYAPCERVLDAIIGTESIDEDGATTSDIEDMRSPFRDAYLGTGARDRIAMLSAMRRFVAAVREHVRGKTASVADLVRFVDTARANGVRVFDETPYANAESAVTLITSHAAKGLEFERVHVLDCSDKQWFPGGGRVRIPMPINLPIRPDGDGEGDVARLFYVAVTRAKRRLALSSHRTDSKGKERAPLRFTVAGEVGDAALRSLSERHEHKVVGIDVAPLARSMSSKLSLTPDERVVLLDAMHEYRLSVTHLNSFLNVIDAGPATFLERHLLRFPQAKSADAAYGSAMHEAIRVRQIVWKRDGVEPDFDALFPVFSAALDAERLLPLDHTRLLEKGADRLKRYLDRASRAHAMEDVVEAKLFVSGLDDTQTRLTGNIDRIRFVGDDIEIRDVKTGKPFDGWDIRSGYEAKKAWDYGNQLAFYAILTKHSRDYSNKNVIGGAIEFADADDRDPFELLHPIESSDVERVSALARIVYSKVTSLDFPDISSYSKDRAGIAAFEDDLLSGRI